MKKLNYALKFFNFDKLSRVLTVKKMTVKNLKVHNVLLFDI